MSATPNVRRSRTGLISTRSIPALAICLCGLCAIQPALRAEDPPSVVLSLSQAIDLALQQNRNLKLARLAIDEDKQKKEIARSAYFPHISNQSSILHVTELAGVDIPAGAFGVPAATGAIPPQSLFIGQGAATSYTSGTQLTQPVTQAFKIHEANRAAMADVNTAKIQLTQAENDIALKVRQLYFDLLTAQVNLQAALDEVTADQIKNQEASDSVADGHALEVTALESHATLLDARQTELKTRLQIHDLTLSLDDLLGLPLSAKLQLDPAPPGMDLSIPTREECIRFAHEQSPSVKAAQQAVVKARAGLAAARDEYIPDVTGLARYSYQSGVPLLVHNFGTFGVNLSYDLFDGGRRTAEVRSAKILLSQAQVSLDEAQEKVAIDVETAYDKIEQLQDLVHVAEESLNVRMEAARLADRQYEQGVALASTRAENQAKTISARASLLEATLGLSLAKGDLERTIGQIPR